MYPTLEVRWFFHEEAPHQVLAWFGLVGRSPESEPARTDLYLRQPGVESVGIKLRQGRIEIKQRRREYGEVRFQRQVSGLLEGWRKWSFGLAGDGEDSTLGTTAWTAVTKVRRLCRFELLEDLRMNVVPSDAPIVRGCDLELTRIECDGQKWWSLGLEAFGAEAGLQQTFLQVGGHLFREGRPGPLAKDTSYGYPRWLTITASGER